VFLHCIEGEDIWTVFNDVVHFFGMLFSTIRKWSPSEFKYERGAWLRIYGVPIHAWTEDFFSSDYVSWIQADLYVPMNARSTREGWFLHMFLFRHHL